MTKPTRTSQSKTSDIADNATEIVSGNEGADYGDLPFSKEKQLAASPGRENRPCPNSGLPKRSCDCYSCRGRRARAKGATKQRQARRGLEKVFQTQAGPSQISTSHEEHWRLPVRVEVKAGGMAKTVDTFYRNTKNQSDKDKAIGDVRPFVAVAQVDGSTDGLVVIRMSHLVELFEDARRAR